MKLFIFLQKCHPSLKIIQNLFAKRFSIRLTTYSKYGNMFVYSWILSNSPDYSVFIGGIRTLHFNVSDLNSYIGMLFSSDPWAELDSELQTNDAFFHACRKYLLSPVNRITFFRCFTTHAFCSAIGKKCLCAPIKVKLHPFSKGYAYMLDQGEVHVGSNLLFGSNQITFISVLLHEIAHIVLSQDSCYDRLLQFDHCFAERFFSGQYNELLKTVTPIEFYAQFITDLWCVELASQITDKRLKKLFSEEFTKSREKLTAAISLLKSIS